MEDVEEGTEAEQRSRNVQATYQYGLVLLLLLLTFFFIGISPDGRFGPLVVIAIESVTLLVTLKAAGSRRWLLITSALVAGLAMLAGIGHAIADDQISSAYTSGMSALIVLLAPTAILRSSIKRKVLDIQSVLAALCLYVMIGLSFSFIFGLIQQLSGQPFFAQGSGTPSSFLYFSFATITTVGYGDLTGRTGLGHTLAVFEAMLGQMYLVTVVALLVSNLGPVMSRRRDEAASTAQSA